MSDDACFYYRGYLLMCDPTLIGQHGFRANAAIRQRKTGDTLIAHSPEGVTLLSREAAIEYARAWAVD